MSPSFCQGGVLMTVEEIYRESIAWIFEKSSSQIYDNYILPITRKVLAEIFEENNLLRMKRDMLPLLEIPTVSSRKDNLDDLGILPEYQRNVIPKGIDSNFLMDDDLNKMSKYDVEYNNARVALLVMVPQDKVEYLRKKAEENAI